MPSPFPGMNPYLEQAAVWHTFHEQFLPHCMEVLVAQVRPAYSVRIDEHVYLHERSAGDRAFLGRADVGIAARPSTRGATGSSSAGAKGAAIAAPVMGRFPAGAVDAERVSFLEIRDREQRRLVTVVELLSPSNKRPGPDREQYLAKRRQLYEADVNLVEIDLLRGGVRPPVDGRPECDYCITVSRAADRPNVGIWPLRLRDPLPAVPVPLRAPDADARIDLQALLHRLYDAGGYADDIYAGEPEPPLAPADADWARGLAPAG